MRRSRVLMIENDPDMQSMVRHVLDILDQADVVVESNTVDGIRAARETAPDLVIVDNKPPQVDAAQVVRTLKADSQARSIPVLVLVATPNTGSALVAEGADDFLHGVFDVQQLVRKVKQRVRAGRLAS